MMKTDFDDAGFRPRLRLLLLKKLSLSLVYRFQSSKEFERKRVLSLAEERCTFYSKLARYGVVFVASVVRTGFDGLEGV
jgi:hypothetical protein